MCYLLFLWKSTKHIWFGYKPPKTLSIHMLRKDQVWQQILWRSHLCWAHFSDGPREQEKAEGDTWQAQKIKGKGKAIICLKMILLWALTTTSQPDRFTSVESFICQGITAMPGQVCPTQSGNRAQALHLSWTEGSQLTGLGEAAGQNAKTSAECPCEQMLN